ncbi:hypothetical protein CS063_11355 [Sporanaerobium hydrogeniformans]|uniref:Uncharacterized protein n=1 Tax=Sporanaerobium hydrogeniformans TaxID=3072179 RepID=A0AC61DBW0_9FIRM|nr:glycoside hydrolase family 95 protein [Sporanaerobium hydrogeniformans]PHV70258.1 hypothetical protein CS063_11355 [Sporanaerobium hydrogeniformans]
MRNKNYLYADQPAKCWQEGFPLGNGFMGVMLYGGYELDLLDLSEATFWSGAKSEANNQPSAASAWREMRRLVECEDYETASQVAEQFIGRRHNYGSNLPVGQLRIGYNYSNKKIESYKRSLDLNTALAVSEYSVEGKAIKTEAFLSYPKQCFCMRIFNPDKEKMAITLEFRADNKPFQVNAYNNTLYFDVQAREKIHSDGKSGTTLQGYCKVILEEGTCREEAGQLIIDTHSDLILCVAMCTDFNGRDPKEALGVCKLNTFSEYEAIKQEHIKDFSKYMDRVELTLDTEGDMNDKTLSEYLHYLEKTGKNNKLTELLFQYGRYLLLSSSREQSILPTHLQGIWNDSVACQIEWTCDMHLDINTQMNYWLSEPGNLAECHHPLFRWMEQCVIPSGRESAQKSYGLSGWSADLVSNAWGFTAPYWSNTISPCPTSGIWMASDYMEHYRYTQDYTFLKEHAYPVISEAIDFFEEYVFYNKEGKLSCGPSISPENSFMKGDKEFFFSNGCTYELVMIRELFRQYEEIVNILEAHDDLNRLDQQRRDRIKQLEKELLPYRILEDGTLAEWNHNYTSRDKQHRHTSHLLGVFPYSQITPKRNPDLAKAVEYSLEKRLEPSDNWEDTGWARALVLLYYCRLHQPEKAYRHLYSLQSKLLNPNLMVMHPPTRGAGSFAPVYELDGNTGCSMAIIEMLMQSHNGQIHLLPCLPKEWKRGHIKGIKARGNIEVAMKWDKGELISADFIGESKKNISIVYKGIEIQLNLEAGRMKTVKASDFLVLPIH